MIFGIFWLLGYQFSPRIADVGGARFWRVDPAGDYGPLDKLASHRAKTGIITEHWDDLLRLAGSLKLGLVQVGGLMRTLQTNERPTRLARGAGGTRPDRQDQDALPAGLHRRRSLERLG